MFINRKTFSSWYDYKGIAWFEILPRNQAVNSKLNIQELTKLLLFILLQEKQVERVNKMWFVAKLKPTKF